MKIHTTTIDGVTIFEPAVFADARGLFFESFNKHAMARAGITAEFVQDNQSLSRKHVLRGLHYQIQQPQGKLVRVIAGEVLDIAVDIRRSSPTFGQHVSVRLSAQNHRVLWIPPGFAHGFVALSDDTEFVYKTTDFYAPQHERTILWNDPALKIDWGLAGEPVLSAKDAAGRPLAEAEVYA